MDVFSPPTAAARPGRGFPRPHSCTHLQRVFASFGATFRNGQQLTKTMQPPDTYPREHVYYLDRRGTPEQAHIHNASQEKKKYQNGLNQQRALIYAG